jgi:acetyl esterase/lipase
MNELAHLRHAAHTAHSYWAVNKLLAGAGARTVGGRIRRQPHPAGWTVPYEGMVRMMMAGTPSHDIHSAQQIRAPLDRLTQLTRPVQPAPRRVAFTHLTGEWLIPAGAAADRCVYYLHGGGYVCGSCATHRAVVGRIAGAAGVPVFSLEYRLAPEHPCPAAVVDAWMGYWWLLEQGFSPHHIVLAGDSAGGGLALALLVALRDAGLPMPAGAALLSPWVDLALTAPSLTMNEGTDYLNLAILDASAAMYLAGRSADEPLASPLYADLRRLPPLLVQVGTAEMLLDDGVRLAERGAAAGVDVTLERWDDMVHVWHFMFLIEPRARQAIRSIARFVQRQTGRPPGRSR